MKVDVPSGHFLKEGDIIVIPGKTGESKYRVEKIEQKENEICDTLTVVQTA